MDRCGIAHTQEEVNWLVSEIEKLKPFPDVVAALEKLQFKGYRLAILSNGDRDMLKAAGPHIGFSFDHVISVQEAGYFKPHWKTYAKAEEIIGYDRSNILFVATTPSTALAQNRTACGPHLSTDGRDHSVRHRINLI
jgi:2-haloacid dehalogenase